MSRDGDEVFEIGLVAQFEAAHALRGEFGPAQRLHGHTYRVEVAARGRALRADGALCDLGALQQAVDQVVGELNYRALDELPAFAGRNSTVEAVARHLFEQLAERVSGQGLESLKVRVWESPQVWGGYEGELPG